jgi:hypothetical protein
MGCVAERQHPLRCLWTFSGPAPGPKRYSVDHHIGVIFLRKTVVGPSVSFHLHRDELSAVHVSSAPTCTGSFASSFISPFCPRSRASNTSASGNFSIIDIIRTMPVIGCPGRELFLFTFLPLASYSPPFSPLLHSAGFYRRTGPVLRVVMPYFRRA